MLRCFHYYLNASNFDMYWNIKTPIHRLGLVTFSLLIKICTTDSKFYSFLRTSISIYRKKWKSDVLVPSRVGKSFASTTHRWGQKVLLAGERSYSCVRRKFSVLREGGGGDACAPPAGRADVTVLLRTWLPEQGFVARWHDNSQFT